LPGSSKASVWTSGSSEGESCDLQRKFSWCSSGTQMSDSDVNNTEFWTKGATPNGTDSSERCLSLNLESTSFGLIPSDCKVKQPFICQVWMTFFLDSWPIKLKFQPSCNSSSCPQSCNKDVLLPRINFQLNLIPVNIRSLCFKTILWKVLFRQLKNWIYNLKFKIHFRPKTMRHLGGYLRRKLFVWKWNCMFIIFLMNSIFFN